MIVTGLFLDGPCPHCGLETSCVNGAFFNPGDETAVYVCVGCASIIEIHKWSLPTPLPAAGLLELRTNRDEPYLQRLRHDQESAAGKLWG